MTTLIVLAAGKGTRVGGAFKPAVLVGGKRMIEWQRNAAAADRLIIVANRSTHFPERGAEMVWTDEGGGPVRALQIAMSRIDEPCVVAYADTWWSRTPAGSDWVGVCRAEGGRVWDWVGYNALQERHTFHRDHIAANSSTRACVGLYAFSDPDYLSLAVDRAMTESEGGEVHMIEVLNRYENDFDLADIPEWMDVGTVDAWRRTDAALRGVA